MKKREIIDTGSARYYVNEGFGMGDVPTLDTPTGSRSSFGGGSTGGGWLNSLLENGGSIFSGIADIVGAARTKTENVNITNSTTNRNIDEAHASFWQGNGTTITALIIGGVAVIVTLVICLKK